MTDFCLNKISIVMTARNDNYGGNLLNRINTSLRVLATWASELEANLEVVIVDYNPVLGKELLYDALSKVQNKFFMIRFIVVPTEFHRRLVNSDKVPMFEYIAKNIGIRRASGEYVLVTNPDIIFSKGLIEYICKTKLQPECFYRAERTDITLSYFESNLETQEILKLCKKTAYRRLGWKGNTALTYRYMFEDYLKNFKMIIRHPLEFFEGKINAWTNPLFDNAAGDFLLMHRSLWDRLMGYDEDTTSTSFMDGYILYVALCLKAKQQIIPFPMYHIYHDSSDRNGRPVIAGEKYRKNCRLMIKNKIPYKLNSPQWGAQKVEFQEKLLKFERN